MTRNVGGGDRASRQPPRHPRAGGEQRNHTGGEAHLHHGRPCALREAAAHATATAADGDVSHAGTRMRRARAQRNEHEDADQQRDRACRARSRWRTARMMPPASDDGAGDGQRQTDGRLPQRYRPIGASNGPASSRPRIPASVLHDRPATMRGPQREPAPNRLQILSRDRKLARSLLPAARAPGGAQFRRASCAPVDAAPAPHSPWRRRHRCTRPAARRSTLHGR